MVNVNTFCLENLYILASKYLMSKTIKKRKICNNLRFITSGSKGVTAYSKYVHTQLCLICHLNGKFSAIIRFISNACCGFFIHFVLTNTTCESVLWECSVVDFLSVLVGSAVSTV